MAILPNVTVTLIGKKHEHIRATGLNGEFEFRDCPVDNYVLNVEKNGYSFDGVPHHFGLCSGTLSGVVVDSRVISKFSNVKNIFIGVSQKD
jgi:hypothetical protein